MNCKFIFLISILGIVFYGCSSPTTISRGPKSLDTIEHQDLTGDLVKKSQILSPHMTQIVSKKIQQDLGQQCPGEPIASSCGNGICNTEKENHLNCPIDCTPNLIKTYNRTQVCYKTRRVYHPRNIEEVKQVIQTVSDNRGNIRIIGAKHSANSLLCNNDVAISSKYFNRIWGIENFKGKEVVKVDGGVTIGKLTDWLHKKDRSLEFAIPSIRWVTVAGAIGTASHGGSVHHPTIISSKIVSLGLINSSGEFKEYSSDNTSPDEWKALRANLGMLGYVAWVKLEIAPQFNLKTTFSFRGDNILFKGKDPSGVAAHCDYSHIYWWPIVGQIANLCGKKSSKRADYGARITTEEDFAPPLLIDFAREIVHRSACYPDLTCFDELVGILNFKFTPPMVKGNWGFMRRSNTVTGPSHKMISSDFGQANLNFPLITWEITIPQSESKRALEFIKKSFQRRKCNPLILMLVRFAPVEDTTLISPLAPGGKFQIGEKAMVVEMVRYFPRGFFGANMEKYDRFMANLMKQLIVRFQGRTHWGKSKDWVFSYQKEKRTFGNRLNRFRKIANKFDPQGLFSNDFLKGAGL